MKSLSNSQPIHSRFLLAVLPIVLLVVFSSAAIFFYHSYAIKEQSILEIQTRTVENIFAKLNTILAVPHRINGLNQGYLAEVCSVTDALEKIQRLFANQLRIFPETNLISVGLADGEYAEAQRLSDGRLRVGARGKNTRGDLVFWDIDGANRVTPAGEKVPDYDPRVRPWYTASRSRKSAGWSPVYFYSSNNQPAISANQPFFGSDGGMLGVLATSVTLDDIGVFLKRIKGIKNGSVFLTEQNGQLLASSRDISVSDGSGKRRNIGELDDPVFSYGARKLLEIGEKDEQDGPLVSMRIDIGRHVFRAALAEYSGPYGLKWHVLMFLPESSFFPNIGSSLLAGFVAALIALGVTVLAVFKMSSWVSRPVFELSALVSAIADNPPHPAQADIPQDILVRRDEIGVFARTFRKMILRLNKAFSALEEEERKYRQLIEDTGSVILKVSADGVILFCNEYGLKIFGHQPQDVAGRPISYLFREDSVERFRTQVYPKLSETPSVFEGEVMRPDGEKLWVTWSLRTISPADGDGVPEIMCTGQDITLRHSMERELSRSLEEKNVLLNEIHHRVKNNLQIIISMLNLQGMKTEAPEIAGTINTIKRRIMSMSLVHELLYRSDSLSHISLGSYLGALTDAVKSTFGGDNTRIRVNLDVDDIQATIETCLTIGLIVNELLSNSYKHAFSKVSEGSILISAKTTGDGSLLVTVSDNGSGKISGQPSESKSGLGTLLINALVSQLGASMNIHSSQGLSTEILIPPGNF